MCLVSATVTGVRCTRVTACESSPHVSPHFVVSPFVSSACMDGVTAVTLLSDYHANFDAKLMKLYVELVIQHADRPCMLALDRYVLHFASL